MAITTSVRPSYAWRMLIIAVVALVLGLWGIYDYVHGIPLKNRIADRFETVSLCQAALESDQAPNELTGSSTEALAAVRAEIERIMREHKEEVAGSAEALTQEQLEAFQESITSGDDSSWLALMLLNADGLQAPRRSGALGESRLAETAWNNNRSYLNQFQETPKRPAAFDRFMQWGFILCLPIVPHCLWRLVQARGAVFRLDDDGTLRLPREGSWAVDDVAGIDMGRWMSKSIAVVRHHDGREVELDDYVHRDLHRIVGALAHRLHPDEWDEQAKPIPSEKEEGDDEPGGHAAS